MDDTWGNCKNTAAMNDAPTALLKDESALVMGQLLKLTAMKNVPAIPRDDESI